MTVPQVRDHADPWPAGPPVSPPVLVAQSWSDAVFLHWRIPVSTAQRYLPPLVEPDVFLGSTWVGLIGFRLHGTRLGGAVPVPWIGDFTEVNVRLYTRGADGSRGVLFVSLDASRLPAVMAARTAGVPYVFSRCRPRRRGDTFGYDVKRFRGQGQSTFEVQPDFGRQAADPLSLELTARFGAHAGIAGRTLFMPNSHRPWPLHPARLTSFDDELLPSAGFPVSGPPESVLFSPGVRTIFGMPRTVRGPETGSAEG